MSAPPDEPTTMTNDRETDLSPRAVPLGGDDSPETSDGGSSPADSLPVVPPDAADGEVSTPGTGDVTYAGEEATEAPATAPAVGDDQAGEPSDEQGEGEDAPEADEHSRGRRAVRSAVEWVLVIGGALLVAFLVKTFLVQAFYIPSESMEPTLQKNDRVLANKLADEVGDLGRGDVIVFERLDAAPANGGDSVNDLIKRVIGLPGDVVEARDGTVRVNGTILDEPYLGDGIRTDDFGPVTVDSDHVFVMGDNRGNSTDSRVFGQVPEDNIVGRAFVRIWPPTRLGRL